MSETKAITKTKEPLHKEALIKKFRSMGIKKDDIVLVHSSLSKLGFVIGGAQTVVESLLETLSEGTLVMPTHSADLSDPKNWQNPPVPTDWHKLIYQHMPAFNKDITGTRGMGKIPETLLRMQKSVRSNHPQTSFTALGSKAIEITENHALTPMFGLDTPLGKLYKLPTKIVLLGVSFDSCTAFHLSEVLTKKLSMKSEGAPLIIEGKRQWIAFEDYDYTDSDFMSFGDVLIEKGIAKVYTIGLTNAIILPFKQSVDIVKALIIETRFND